jgi:RNA polymerase sigma-70 factor (ECF subfamily)
VQEAFARAVERWPRDGTPRNPGAWIATTARNCAIERIRRDRTLDRKRELLARLEADRPEDPDVPETSIPDERLALIFACCHPALAMDAQVALTLRMLGGLTTDEIARAFLVPEPTMAQRLLRAKRKVRTAGIPIRVPPAHLLPDRIRSVHAVLYLVFNQGYGPPPRDDVLDEALRLGKLLAVLMPDDAESLGLLALMLFHDSRRAARLDAAGDLVLLKDQDRTRWDRERIEEGRRVLDRAIRLRRPGPYQLQAAIASLSAEDEVDWDKMVALYGRLAELALSAVVELNRAVAVAEAEGAASGLQLLDGLDADLGEYHLLHSARADFLRRLDRPEEAATSYRRALELAPNETERRYLARRLAELG